MSGAIRKYRQIINQPYTPKGLITLIGTLIPFLILPIVILSMGSQPQSQRANAQEKQLNQRSDKKNDAEFTPNELLIKVKKASKGKVKENDFNNPGIKTLKEVFKEHKPKKFEKIVNANKKSNLEADIFSWYKIVIEDNAFDRSPAAKVNKIIAKLLKDPDIETAQPNFIVKTTAVPNDPYYSSTGSWGQTYPDLWGLKKINIEKAWDQTIGSPSVIVASIDTGVDRNHEDIKDNMWINNGEIPNNGVDDDRNGYVDDYYGWDFANNDNDPVDDHGHGTHTSGTIAGIGNNGIGVVGLNWTTKIMALKFLGSDGSGTLDGAIKSLQYAADMGANISSNSWGAPFNSQAIDDAVKYEHDKGMVIIAAAGNDNADALDFSPASSDYVVTVAASDPNDLKASFSNWGEKIDVAAPGVDILSIRSSVNPMCTAARTVGTNYCRVSGTSMATPHVAGLAALLLAKDPALTNEEIRQLIRLSASDLGTTGKDQDFGYGRIDASFAFASTSGKPLSPVITSPSSRTKVGGQIQIFGSVAGPNFASYKIEGGGGRSPTTWITLAQSSTQVINGTLATVDTAKLPEGANIFRLTASTTDGKSYQFQVYDINVDNVDAEITLPALLIPKGTVDIYGTAQTKNGLGFNSFMIDWQQTASLKWWAIGVTRENNGQSPVINNKLGTIDTIAAGFADGQTYSLRLTVVDSNNRNQQYIIPLILDQDLVPGWPKPVKVTYNFGYYDFITPATADLDGNGSKEVIILEPSGKIDVYNKNGSNFPGFPVSIETGYYFSFPVNIADLNNDGKKEIITAAVNENSNSKIYIYSYDGKLFSGWPTPQFYSGYKYNDITPSITDLNLDGKKDLVFADSNGNLHALNLDGTELPNFPKKVFLNNHYGGALSIADINKDGKPEILAVSSDVIGHGNYIYVLDNTGTVLPGWPYHAPSPSGTIFPVIFNSTPAAGDVDGDGNLEVFAVGQVLNSSQPSPDAIIYGWRKDGTVLSGWPIIDGRVIPASTSWSSQPVLSTPSIADVDGDGKDEVVVATYGIKVYGASGLKYKEVAGGNGITSPSISDVDGDGKLELSSIYNYILRIIDDNNTQYWQRTYGNSQPPWNSRKFLSPAMISDLDNNGKAEMLVVHSRARETTETDSYAFLWELPNPTSSLSSFDWPMFGYDAARTGRSSASVSITPMPTIIPTSTPIPPTSTPLPTQIPTSTPILQTPSPTPISLTISNVLATNITTNNAKITWLTSVPGTSRVTYGTRSNNLNLSTPLDSSFITSHAITISGLKKNTTYYYRVYSKNVAGIEFSSLGQSFRTLR